MGIFPFLLRADVFANSCGGWPFGDGAPDFRVWLAGDISDFDIRYVVIIAFYEQTIVATAVYFLSLTCLTMTIAPGQNTVFFRRYD